MDSKKLIVLGLIVLGLGGWLLLGKKDNPATAEPSNSIKTVIVSGHPEWSPIMYKSGEEITGAGPALVKLIMADLGIEAQYPATGTWDEVQEKAKSGEVDMLVAAYKTDARIEYMDYSDAYTTDPVAIFVKTGSALKFEKWDDLVGKKGIGTVGDSYGQEFDSFSAEKLNLSRASTSGEAFNKLRSGEVDYFVYSLYAGAREIKAQSLQDQLTSLPKYVAEENFYITISKKSPLVSSMGRINELLAKYKSDGTINRLIEEYKSK